MPTAHGRRSQFKAESLRKPHCTFSNGHVKEHKTRGDAGKECLVVMTERGEMPGKPSILGTQHSAGSTIKNAVSKRFLLWMVK